MELNHMYSGFSRFFLSLSTPWSYSPLVTGHVLRSFMKDYDSVREGSHTAVRVWSTGDSRLSLLPSSVKPFAINHVILDFLQHVAALILSQIAIWFPLTGVLLISDLRKPNCFPHSSTPTLTAYCQETDHNLSRSSTFSLYWKTSAALALKSREGESEPSRTQERN